jgi:hypothetical protein
MNINFGEGHCQCKTMEFPALIDQVFIPDFGVVLSQ